MKQDKELLTRIADELRMQNFIKAIENPTIFNSLLREDQLKLLNIVKDYLNNNVKEILDEQKPKTR